jgi:hypothetical protein
MNRLLKVTFLLSITTITVWFIRPILFWAIGLDFADSKLELSYVYSWRFILPSAILLTISKEFIDGRRPQNLLKSILIRTVISAFSIFLVVMSLFTNMCGWIEKELYYTSKFDTGKIVLMEYGCGATDSNPNPKQEIKIIRPINNLFIWVHNCDTTDIDQNEWVKIK